VRAFGQTDTDPAGAATTTGRQEQGPMAESESNIAGEKLMSLIQRIERLEEDRSNIGADIREIYREAKGIGFEPKIIRQLVKMRKMEASDRQEEEALIESYKAAIGMP
jgi:uncharacterized protein (UPF0335 family)